MHDHLPSLLLQFYVTLLEIGLRRNYKIEVYLFDADHVVRFSECLQSHSVNHYLFE